METTISTDTTKSASAGTGGLSNPRDIPMVEFIGVSKHFGATKALSHVDLKAARGTVHSLTGENGAGKSTLMKLLSGVHQPTEGQILVDGEAFTPHNPHDSLHLGVSTIYQELNLIPNLSVAENLFFGREPKRFGMIDRLALAAMAQKVLDRLGMDVDPRKMCGELTIAEQQFIEIGKGLTVDAKIYIFDEPTAALNGPESERLFELINALRAEGKLIFYISHRLDEVFRLSDDISVMKDGEFMGTFPRGTIDEAGLVKAMVGRELGDFFPPRAEADQIGDAKLNVGLLRVHPDHTDIDFTLHAGEIVGLAGLEGQGQREIIRALTGLETPHAAEIKLETDGSWQEVHPKQGIVRTIRDGIGFVPEDRKTEGLFLTMSIERNVALGHFRLSDLFHLAPRGRRRIREMMDRLRLKASGLDQNVKELSGGNQQKVMIGRWMASGVDVLLIEEPTRGVDVGAKAEIYANLRQFTKAGGAILITSSELMEVIGLCDRILVVRENKIVAEMSAEGTSEEDVMEHAVLKTREEAA